MPVDIVLVVLLAVTLAALFFKGQVQRWLGCQIFRWQLRRRGAPLSMSELPEMEIESEEDLQCAKAYVRALDRNLTLKEFRVETHGIIRYSHIEPELLSRARQVTDDLMEIVNIERFCVADSPEAAKIPFWEQQVRTFPLCASLRLQSDLDDMDWNSAIQSLRLASTIAAHLSQMPIPWASLKASAAAWAVSDTMVPNFIQAGFRRQISPSLATIAAESVIALRSPFETIQFDFTWALDFLDRMPLSCRSRMPYDPDDMPELSVGPRFGSILDAVKQIRNDPYANLEEAKAVARTKLLASYNWLTKYPLADGASGIEMLNASTSAAKAARIMEPFDTCLYDACAPPLTAEVRLHLATETLRRMNICAARILLALTEGGSWETAVALDSCRIDPFSNTEFKIRPTEGLIILQSYCPNYWRNEEAGPIEIHLDVSQFL